MFKKEIAEGIYAALMGRMSKDEIMSKLEVPADSSFGEFSFPTFTLAGMLKKSPKIIAEELSKDIKLDIISEVKAVNGFLNFYINRNDAAEIILSEIEKNAPEDFYNTSGQTIVIDYSSPNIAKPFSMGHLRATILGDSLARILKKTGADVIGINHLGDWGTQFGKLITAYKKWGSEEKVSKNPIKELFELYQKFHVEAESTPELEDKARQAFSLLEQGNDVQMKLWNWFREVSIESFEVLYKRLGIDFDYIQGESFYNDKLSDVNQLLERKKLIEFDQGAYIVRLNNLPPALIKKRDGESLYITRDIAAMLHRVKHFQADQILYVVGQEQSVHFNQLSQISDILNISTDIEHVPFGLILKNGRKMSTRKGSVILLDDIIRDVEHHALNIIAEKNPDLKNKENIASHITDAAVKFMDLKHDRMNSYEFNIEDMLRFDGETGVYVMYTNSRIQSILRKADKKIESTVFKFDENMWPVINQLSKYHAAVKEAAEKRMPSEICKYVIKLCREFNIYYAKERIINSNNDISKLYMLKIVSNNIEEAMSLLGIKTVNEM